MPLATDVRITSASWEEALRRWLNGGILSAETRNHVGNFLSVHRVRPAAISDDAVSDAEVELEAADVQDLFRRSAAGGSGGIEDDARAPRRQELFESACADADKTWGPGDAGADATAELPCLNYDLTAARKAAKRSQQSSKAPTDVGLFEPRHEENVRSMEARSVETEVGQWLENVSTR